MQKGIPAFNLPRVTVGWTSLLILSAGLAHAVMIRHDVAEQKYFELAKQPEFAAGLTAILDHRGTYSGVLIGERYIMTAGHPVAGYMRNGKKEGPMAVKVRIQGVEYETEHAFLHPDYPHKNNGGGADLAIVRLKQHAGMKAQAATLLGHGLKTGDRITGVGKGKTGTGNNNNEPKDGGLFRGYENIVPDLFNVWRTVCLCKYQQHFDHRLDQEYRGKGEDHLQNRSLGSGPGGFISLPDILISGGISGNFREIA